MQTVSNVGLAVASLLAGMRSRGEIISQSEQFRVRLRIILFDLVYNLVDGHV
jgi:hypothetical protein